METLEEFTSYWALQCCQSKGLDANLSDERVSWGKGIFMERIEMGVSPLRWEAHNMA